MSKSNSLRDIFHKNGLTYSELTNPDGTTNPTYVSMGLDGFNEAITQIIALVDSKVIGEDEELDFGSENLGKTRTYSPIFRNNLRDQMRTNLKKLMGKK